MSKLSEKISEYLISKGYSHKVCKDVTYNCSYAGKQLYDEDGVIPDEMPSGPETVTVNKEVDVPDEHSIEELKLIVQMETEKHIKTIKNIAIFFAVMLAISVLLSVIQYFGMSAALKDLTSFKW